MCDFILSATPAELADQLGAADVALQQASERMDAIERELRRRGIDRAAGERFAVVLGDDGACIVNLTMIAAALNGAAGEATGTEH